MSMQGLLNAPRIRGAARFAVLLALFAVSAVTLSGCPLICAVVPTVCDTGAETATLTVINDSSASVVEFYFSLSTDPDWGPNQLDEDLLPGESITFTDIDPGTYDLLAVFDDETEAEEDGLLILGGDDFEWTLTDK